MIAARGVWAEEDKVRAVTVYLASGSVSFTSEALGINEATLRAWKRAAWWVEIETGLRNEGLQRMSGRLQRLVNASLDAVEDRLEKGDYLYDQRMSTLVRMPVSAKTANKIANDLMERQVRIEQQKTQNIAAEAVSSHLANLAAEFSKQQREWVQRCDPANIIDAEIVDDPVTDGGDQAQA